MRSMISTRGCFTFQETFDNVWRNFWLSQLGGITRVQWLEARMLLSVLQCTGQALQQGILQPEMSAVPRLGKLERKKRN